MPSALAACGPSKASLAGRSERPPSGVVFAKGKNNPTWLEAAIAVASQAPLEGGCEAAIAGASQAPL